MFFVSFFRLSPIFILSYLPIQQVYALEDASSLAMLSLEALTSTSMSTASRFVQPASHIPASTTVITRNDILRHGWRNLSEILLSLPGFVSASDGIYTYLGSRGRFIPGDFNSRILLQIDNMRLNDNVMQQAMFGDEFPLDVNLIDRIEYVAGPSSAIYGAHALLGVVNVITRKGTEMSKAKVTAYLSSEQKTHLSFSGTQTLGSGITTFSLSGGYLAPSNKLLKDPYAQLYDELGQTVSNPYVIQRDDLDYHRAFLRYESGALNLTARYGSREIFPGNAPYDSVFLSPTPQKVIDTLWSVNGSYYTNLNYNTLLNVRSEIAGYRFASYSSYLDAANQLYVSPYLISGIWNSNNIYLLYAGLKQHKIVIGTEYQHDIRAWQQEGTNDNPSFSINPHEYQYAFYLQDEWSFPSFIINTALRWDADSASNSVLSPRLGLVWPLTTQTTLKFAVSQAFRPASDYEREYTDGDIYYSANPNLRPEIIRSYEAILEYQQPQTFWRFSLFNTRLVDLINSTTLATGALQYQNNGRLKAQGLETVWRKNFDNNIDINASISLTRPTDEFGYNPKTVAKLSAAYPIANNWTFNIESHYQQAANFAWQNHSVRIPSHATHNLHLFYKNTPRHLDVSLQLKNALNKKYDIPSSPETAVPTLAGQKRTLAVELRYAF